MIRPFQSSSSQSDGIRVALGRAQARLAEANEELASGRHADMGRALGVRVGTAISLRVEHMRLSELTTTNGIASSRLSLSQDALKGIVSTATAMLDALVAARSSKEATGVATETARSALQSVTSLLNTSYEGQYLFSGINTDQMAMHDYFAEPPPASKQSVDAAFLGQFGFQQDDPSAATLTSSDMQTFLDGPFSALFDESQWKADWSGASSTRVESRIAPTEVVATSASAAEEPIRDLARALTMVADLGVEGLGEEARQTLLDKAIQLTNASVAGIGEMMGRLGIAEERVARASERMSVSLDIIARDIGGLENVDATEASVRVTSLTTLIETSFALTARLSRMSLVNYL